MANDVIFTDNSVQVMDAIDDAIIAYLHEAGGELASKTVTNSRPMKYGKNDVKNSWKYVVDKDAKEAKVGNSLEAAYWEELGTGEYALNKDGRKGWWVYVEGQDTPRSNQKSYTEEEAKEVATYLRVVKGLDAHATKGIEANRPLYRAFTSIKTKLIKRAEQVFKARFDK